MFIVLYYVVGLLYAYLLTLLFHVDFTDYTNPFTYILTIVALLIGLIVSFATVILFIFLLGKVRNNKEYDNKLNHKLANSILALGLHIMRVKVNVSGKENIPQDKNFVLVGNHQENWDILILKVIFKDKILNFIAKEALTRLPIFGVWIALLGNIFISREADRSAAESIVKGIRQVKKGTNMGIFPEGKRTFGNELIDFKAGAFKLAMKPKADILICTQYNTCTIFKKIPWKRYQVYVHIHPIYPYEEYEGLKSQEVSAEVKKRIQNQLDSFKETVK